MLFLIFIGLLISCIPGMFAGKNKQVLTDRKLITQSGVCPPFNLYDEDGNIIDPVNNINSEKPYSPKQTCGKCHDYDKITQGFHFQQGKDETATGTLTERYQWVSNPGNYGGNWCSPAPLYNYLSKKHNTSAKEMDMTSFTFITNGCATCHPGGGPLEFDREGFRYDKHMDSLGYTAGGINNFDGDYYQSHWNCSGVIEADCNLCHLPEYDYKTRNDNLAKFNFRWMATAGSGLATVEGSIKDTVDVKVKYNLAKFGADGKVSMHLVREPRNETCLNCHSKPQWKKRGSSFTEFTDVHIARGVKCVDCHAAGSMAVDKRIKGKEVHQLGKGDDPSGWVRNDLDNTMRTCKECHLTGYLNAPVARHTWLPDLHLDKLSCQACHIPQRKVKSALVQVSDIYNPGTKITPPQKYVWTFYDQNLNYWNHYGELAMFTAKDQPSDPFVPEYAKYRGQIFPVNTVHSAWPGIYTEGRPGLNQPKQKDIYNMWIAHRKDKSKYPELSKITDNNSDTIPEVNTPEEIDEFINSVTACLTDLGYDLAGEKIVWVNDDRMYLNGKDYKMLDKEFWESSPYASVYKYSHDVFPAKAGLGTNGCTDCHSFGSDMFFRQIVKCSFGNDGYPVMEPQYKKLGMSGFMMGMSAFREQVVKSFAYPAILFLLLTILISIACNVNKKQKFFPVNSYHLFILYSLMAAGLAFVFLKPDVNSYVLPDRLTLDANHFIITVFALIAGAYTWIRMKKENTSGTLLGRLQAIFLILAVFSGILMMIKFDLIYQIVRVAYTVFDISVVMSVLISIVYFINDQYTFLKTKYSNTL
ncbi:MAG: multiheme c-type cytochrome [Bacteroidia bacterium]|nr:multiheme c-type cytochrome [Bacteroidia bacterium]